MGEIAQINERKCKEMKANLRDYPLDTGKANLLSFVLFAFANLDFSMGYGRFKQKNRPLYLGLHSGNLAGLYAYSSTPFRCFRFTTPMATPIGDRVRHCRLS
jgi:hypothetical protein